MDAFFASVEILDHPELAGLPVIVGGSGQRGVVASCNYEARAFGVHSAMPSVRARQLCPHAVFIDGHYSRYAQTSERLRTVLLSVTPFVEPIGLDEAFLDVRGALRLMGTSAEIGAHIRRQVREALDLDCSVGAGRTKMIAKLASRAAKPTAGPHGKVPGAGVVLVEPDAEVAFLHPLPVERLWGVGPASAKRLHDLGVRTVGDLALMPEQSLVRRLGRAQGQHLAALARGEDRDPVVADRPTKSVGHEETFGVDLVDRELLRGHLLRMAESVGSQLRRTRQVARTISVKVKFRDFSVVTRSHTVSFGIDTGKAIAAVTVALLEGVDVGDGVRLLGISASGLRPAGEGRQLRFDVTASPGVAPSPEQVASADASAHQESWEDVMAAVDAIRGRFGTEAVGTVSMVGDHGIAVPARREAPWGPSAR